MDERLGVVSARPEAGAGDRALDLQFQDRKIRRRTVIDIGGQKPGEAVLARHLAVRVVEFHADIIEVDAAMDGRSEIRLGDDDRVGRGHERRDRRGQFAFVGERRLENPPRAVLENPKIGLLVMREFRLAASGGVGVSARAEKGEFRVVQPFEKFNRFLTHFSVAALDPGGFQLIYRGAHARRHFREIADRERDIGENAFDLRFQPRDFGVINRGVHFGVDHRLGERAGAVVLALALGVARDRDDGVDEKRNLLAAFGERARHAVDDEGHVVGRDVEHKARLAPVRGLDETQRHLRLAGAAFLARLERFERARQQARRFVPVAVFACRETHELFDIAFKGRRQLAGFRLRRFLARARKIDDPLQGLRVRG